MPRLRSRTAGASLDEIEHVYRERGAEFQRIAAAIVLDREVARDVVQDAFAGLVHKRDTFAQRGSVEAWAWRAVVNTALNRRRHARRRMADPLVEVADSSAPEPDPSPDGRVLASLNALPERQRPVVFLRYYADLDYTTIGTALGVSSGTVASALNSAHQSLGRQLPREVIR
jgi:RNA polymerase sigma factor (sigma-70 family)